MGIRPNKLLIQSLQLSWLYSLQDRLFISCLGPTKHLKKLMLKVCGENMELPPRARCPAGAALSSQQHSYSRQGELYMLNVHGGYRCIQRGRCLSDSALRPPGVTVRRIPLPSALFIVKWTPESGPKHSALHGMGLPAATDVDVAEVKAKKPEKLKWELNLGKRDGKYCQGYLFW